jgi:hypothetical protein
MSVISVSATAHSVPDWDPNAYAKKLNEALEARWAKEKETKEGKSFPSHPIPD